MHINKIDSRVERTITAVLPRLAQDLERLRCLGRKNPYPVVTVVGKYNHGKSRLLNELIGERTFAESDSRKTVVLSEHVHDQVRWLDAPGLDADVFNADDDYAHQAIWLESDIRLFVHAAKEGELDIRERELLETLCMDAKRTRRQTLCVLSQVDQLADEYVQLKVIEKMEAQVPGLTWLPVASTRHRRGLEESKKLLLEKSGIPQLKGLLLNVLACVQENRAHETALLMHEMREQLEKESSDRQKILLDLRHQQMSQRQLFDSDLASVQEKNRHDIQDLLLFAGQDHSLEPDTFEDLFVMTPGKLERNRLQVAYSKACIRISAILTKHGAMELPFEQQTNHKSLDSVIVAVMGVSVKYRKDLQRLFCEPAGRAQLVQDFTRYFELSADRVALTLRIREAQAAWQAGQEALEMLAEIKGTA